MRATAGNGWYFTCGCLDATIAANAKEFTAAYTAAYNTPPSTYSPEAFDATNALIQAIKAAKAGGTVTRASVETAVNTIDYKGITDRGQVRHQRRAGRYRARSPVHPEGRQDRLRRDCCKDQN